MALLAVGNATPPPQDFIDTFCATSDYSKIGSAFKGATFLFESFSPCFNDLIFVSGCQIILAVVCIFRFWMQCSSGFERFRFRGFSSYVVSSRRVAISSK